MIKKALLSVSNKTGLDKLVRALSNRNIEIISSGGTAEYIRRAGYSPLDISQYTGMPEMPGGLVKTLHPKIHGGILGDVEDAQQRAYMRQYSIEKIELVVVNFYPFQKIVSEKQIDVREAAHYIDIGGPALVRAAAKAALLNGKVTILVSPDQYDEFIEELSRNKGDTSPEFKLKMAACAFSATTVYDEAIRQFVEERPHGRGE